MSSWSEARSLIYTRSGGLCEAGVSSRCSGVSEAAHHRKLRSRGGKDTASCLVAICNDCHTWIHLHPADATERGWMVPSWADPCETPVFRYRRWVLLDDQGGMSPSEVPA